MPRRCAAHLRRAADSPPEKDTLEKAEMAADQEDLEMTDTEDPKKVNLNSGT